MSKNPILNALSASAYITLVVSVMNFVTQPLRNKPDTFFAPVIFLSVFTLSFAVMAYLFFYQPFLFVVAGKKKEAISLFLKTVGTFAIITVVALILLSIGII